VRVEGIFRGTTDTKDFQPGEVVFAQGDPGDEMYGIVEGSVELSVDGTIVVVLGPDDVLGEMAIIDSTERMATATVTPPTRLRSIDRRDFMFLVRGTPMFAIQVMSALANRLRPVVG